MNEIVGVWEAGERICLSCYGDKVFSESIRIFERDVDEEDHCDSCGLCLLPMEKLYD